MYDTGFPQLLPDLLAHLLLTLKSQYPARACCL
jgi:hypothetical protein